MSEAERRGGERSRERERARKTDRQRARERETSQPLFSEASGISRVGLFCQICRPLLTLAAGVPGCNDVAESSF